jgi:hypothetical protein
VGGLPVTPRQAASAAGAATLIISVASDDEGSSEPRRLRCIGSSYHSFLMTPVPL